MIRIGVIGAGAHSSAHHGPALGRCREERPGAVELAAICDLDAERARKYADRFGFEKVYTDMETMLGEEDLDGVVAVTPLPLTEEIAGRVIQSGKPLVIEKPPGPTVEAARRLRDRAVESGVPHMVSFNRRFNPALARARAWLAEEAAARRPCLAIARMLRHDRREEGFAFGTGIHLVDAVLSLMGRPEKVESHASPVSPGGTLFFDARVRFADGGAACLAFAPACGRKGVEEESLEIIGEGYDVQVDIGRCRIGIWDQGEQVLEWRAAEDAEDWEREGALDEMRAFIRYLEAGEGWWPTLEDALWSARTADAIQRGGETALEERE